MAGPMSAPNGDKSLLNPDVRENLRKKNQLRTGKTDRKRSAERRQEDSE